MKFLNKDDIANRRKAMLSVVYSFGYWLFALLFLPIVVCQFFYLLWDGGLKEFSLPDNYSIDAGSLWLADKQYIAEKWEKAEKLWKRA